MVPDLTLEVIYLNESTDFKMEFDICGSANIRFLSHITHSKAAFLSTLSKSVVRSRVIVAVGSFNPLDAEFLPSIISKATGYIQKNVDKNALGINSSLEYPLPENAIPLILRDGVLVGCVLESNDQSIIMLTSDREQRHQALETLICPYIKMLSGKETKNSSIAEKSYPVAALKEQRSEEKSTSPIAVLEKQELLTNFDDKPEEKEPIFEALDPESTFVNQNKDGDGFVVLEQPENASLEKYDLNSMLIENTENPQKVRHPLRGIISVLLVLAVLLLAYLGYEFVYQPMHYGAVLKEIVPLYGQSWEGLPDNMNYKFGKLYKMNKDIIGWISIPSTNISLPVVSSSGKIDSFYKTHLFEGSVNNFGTPFTYSKIKEDTYCRNTVIYGNGEGTSSAFSEIKEFLSEEKYRSAPVLSFDSLFLEQRFKIVSVYSLAGADKNEVIESTFFDDSAFMAYANKIVEKSEIKTNIDINPNDELLTLVCEDNKKNIILVARKVRVGENPLVNFDADGDNKDNTSSKDTAHTESDSPLTEIVDETSSETITSSVPSEISDINIGEDRYEQQAPTSSVVEIIPDSPVSSVPTAPDNENTVSVPTAPDSGIPNLPTLSIKNSLNGQTVNLPANEAVAQIIEAEMGSHFHEEALKAQAVAAYSWLLSSGAASGSTPSAPMKTAGSRAINAANAVAGVVALYDGKVAKTSYFPISAGKTADSSSVWSAQLPYLKSVDSSVDKNADKFQTIKTYTAAELAEKVKNSLGIDLTKIADKSTWFNCTYDSGGVYVKTISIGGTVKKGTYFRTDVLNYDIRSSAYTISYNKSDDKFTVVVKGYGHGVGMSQVGANYYAQSGFTYEQILMHYYTGITLGTYTN